MIRARERHRRALSKEKHARPVGNARWLTHQRRARLSFLDVPVFGLAALWKSSARAERVKELVEGLGAVLPSARPPGIVVALREAEATLELKLELPSYPRAAVETVKQQVQRSGGTLVELWRLPKAERDAFHASALADSDTHTLEDYEAAAIVLHGHLQQLAIREPLAEEEEEAESPASSPDKPEEEEVDAPPEPPRTETPEAPRRARRFAVKLEMEFRSELDFVREHATNISNGGLFVRTAHRPPVDSVVTVQVKLPNGKRLQGEALVVHTLDDPYRGGVGLAFLSEDTTFSATLDDYLASLADTPES
jgi:uncharacterized protein (TIGR02266 family)